MLPPTSARLMGGCAATFVPRPVGAPQLDDRTGHDYAGLDVSAMGIEAFMPQPG
jgi:hypothetical protein